MTITVRLFAMLRDIAGTDACPVSLDPGARAEDARDQLAGRHPDLRAWLRVTRPALNLEYCSWQDPLHDGDELALIPPVSGG